MCMPMAINVIMATNSKLRNLDDVLAFLVSSTGAIAVSSYE